MKEHMTFRNVSEVARQYRDSGDLNKFHNLIESYAGNLRGRVERAIKKSAQTKDPVKTQDIIKKTNKITSERLKELKNLFKEKKKGGVMKYFQKSMDPRTNLDMRLGENDSLEFFYNKNKQFSELIERAFCEGYEYAQKEFGREKINPGSIFQAPAGFLDGTWQDSPLFDNKKPFSERGLDIHSTIKNNEIRSRYKEALKGDILNKRNISLLKKKYGIRK